MDRLDDAETELVRAELEVQMERVGNHTLDTFRLRRAEERLTRARQRLAVLRGEL